MGESGWGWSDLDLVVVALGPGGFTGIRVGVAVARALCLAAGLPALGISTFEALSAAVPDDGSDLPIACLIDARRGLTFCQRFGADGRALDEPALLTPIQVELRLVRPHRLIGSGAAAFTVGGHVLPLIETNAVATARAALRRLERGAAPGAGSGLAPLYLREADARTDAGRSLVASA
jgi:tRNA threonylcarbamoyladenosine biosynthesis protein TsaB